MKTSVYTYLIFACVVLFAACDENYLEKSPPQNISAGGFWESETDVQMGLAGCYSRLRSDYLSWRRSFFDCTVDNGWSTTNAIKQMQAGILDEVNANVPNSLYGDCYQGIASCNVFLMNFRNAGLPDPVAKVYEAEARFLRALFYFELVQRWGGVIIYKEIPSNIDGLKIPKSTEEEVYKFIDEDLSFAASNLPDKAYINGHAVRTSAIALQARIALWRGQWETVITLTKSIISSDLYSLVPDLKSQFTKGMGQSDCPEIIFSVKYLETREGRQSSGQTLEFFFWANIAPTKDLIEEYDAADLRLKKWYYHSPERTHFIREDGFTHPLVDPVDTEYGLIKFTDVWDPSIYTTSIYDINCGNDIVLFRLADIYLMYAEAQVEKDGGTTTDANSLEYINKIRFRAGLEDYATLSREKLRKERRMELAFEGLRRFDIVRWKIGSKIDNKLVYDNIHINWDDKFYSWPFAQKELEVNKELVQNSGY